MHPNVSAVLKLVVLSLVGAGLCLATYDAFWSAANDYFFYNATGTAVYVTHCEHYSSSWDRGSVGTLLVRVQPTGTNITFEAHVSTVDAGGCSYSCCSDLIGELVYFQVALSSSGNYSVIDYSAHTVKHRDSYIFGGIIAILSFIGVAAIFGCTVAQWLSSLCSAKMRLASPTYVELQLREGEKD